MSAPFVSLSCSKAAREALKELSRSISTTVLKPLADSFSRRRQEAARRAADQHVHGSKLGAAASEGRVGGDVAHVGGHGTDIGAESAQILRCRIELFPGAAADGNAGAQGGKVLRHARLMPLPPPVTKTVLPL
jgi:hypothetical protein